jgi:uncharacterized glyoxalase superfamily protein PhnB
LQTNRTMPDTSVIPVLVYEDVHAATEWLCRVFGFAERWHVEDHRAQLSFGNGAVVVRDNLHGESSPPARCSVMVRVEHIDNHYQKALALGARVVSAPEDQQYGERQYSAEDPGGHHWLFTQTIADVAPEDWGGTSSSPELLRH